MLLLTPKSNYYRFVHYRGQIQVFIEVCLDHLGTCLDDQGTPEKKREKTEESSVYNHYGLNVICLITLKNSQKRNNWNGCKSNVNAEQKKWPINISNDYKSMKNLFTK
jgi:hypothetical protein